MANPMVASLLTYELRVKGTATSTIEDVRRILKVGLSGVAKSAGPVSAVAWRLGDFEPLLAATLGQFDAWARLWRTCSRDERIMVARAWAQINAGNQAALPWNRVTGPITAIIATLWRAGIPPVGPAAWLCDSAMIRFASYEWRSRSRSAVLQVVWTKAPRGRGGTRCFCRS